VNLWLIQHKNIHGFTVFNNVLNYLLIDYLNQNISVQD